MLFNPTKYISMLLGTVFTSNTAFSQLQVNKPNSSSTIPVVSNIYTPAGYTGTPPLNYIKTWEALGPINLPADLSTATYKNARQSTSYVDGLGRTLQTVVRQATPGTAPKDIVTPVQYDNFGREAYKFMPYVSGASDGLFRTDPFVEQKAYLESQYLTPAEKVFYNKTNFEASPLNRVEKVMAPGNSWAGSGNGIEHKSFVNNVSDEVVIWSIASNALTYTGNDETTNIPTTISGAFYQPGELFKEVALDERNNALVEYKDKEGKIILKKEQIGNIAADYGGYSGFLCTYYIYDDLDNLRFVLPPKAVEAIQPNWVIVGLNTVINELCFRYEYDYRKRIIAKKVPGSGWAYMIYDARDRLVFTQDANMRSRNQWLTNLYDNLNRQVMTGITIYAGTPVSLQAAVTSQTKDPIIPPGLEADKTFNQPTTGDHQATNSITMSEGFVAESSSGFSASILSENAGTVGVEGVIVNKYPIPDGASFTALTITYYDNYNWTNRPYTTAYNSLLNDVSTDQVNGINLHPEDLPTTASSRTIGLVTGSKVRLLIDPNNLSAGGWLTKTNFYDNKSRMIQVQADNQKLNPDILINRYDFTGKVLGTYLVHKNPDAGSNNLRVKTIYKYDPAGRLLETWKTLNDETKTTLVASNEYNELGQLKKKELGQQKDPATGNNTGLPVETLNFTYNVRGWLKGINEEYVKDQPAGSSRWFGMELSYDWGFQSNQLNGNIGGLKWRSKGDGQMRSYGYSYDAMNRLLGADFAQHNGTAYIDNGKVNFDVQIGDGQIPATAYDANGNILAMQQWGLLVNSSDRIDQLQYFYHTNTNKLQRVTDPGNAAVNLKLGDFTDKNTGTDDYGYDKNGNLITDLNKDLSGDIGINPAGTGAIVYNHLNLPWQITIPGKGKITYQYDAAGVKLQKKVEDQSVNGKTVTTTTDYIAGMVYESKTTVGGTPAPGPPDNYLAHLQFIGHEEGRIRYLQAEGATPASFVYDYFVRDHLGNVRMVLTEEHTQNIYPAATLEGSLTTDGLPNAAYKEKEYYSINSAYIVPKSAATGITDYPNKNGGPLALDPPVNNNPNCDATANSLKLYKLNASTNKTGLGITLQVMVGDQINIFGKSYWINTGGNFTDKNTLPVTGLLDALLGSPSMAGKGLVAATLNTTPFIDAVTPFLNRSDNPGASPWAYINWIFLDEQYNYAGGGSDRVGASGTVKTHNNTTIPTITAPKNGYVFVYCSNESNYDVFFDNLQVIHSRGPVLEETHYYPFGLTMAGISSKGFGKLENKYKFNAGTELNSTFDLNLYETTYRSLDPQLGRFWQIDPLDGLSVTTSPYVFGSNNPITRNDPAGAKDTVINGETVQRDKDLAPVTITPPKKAPPINYINWPVIEKGQQDWNDKMYHRILNKQPLSQPNDPVRFSGQEAFHLRNFQAQQDYRKMSIGVVVILGGPLFASSLAGTGYGTIMYNFLVPKLQFSAAGGIADLVTQKTVGGKKWSEVNYASVITNTVLGGRNLISSSLWESTGSFFTLSGNGVGLNFNSAGLKDFATGSVGNLVGNIWGKGFENAGVFSPGKVSLGQFAVQELINIPGEFSGNLITTVISQ